MKVRNIHGRPALWKGNKDYHARKRRERSIRRQAAWAANLLEQACRAYMRPIFALPAHGVFAVETALAAPAAIAAQPKTP